MRITGDEDAESPNANDSQPYSPNGKHDRVKAYTNADGNYRIATIDLMATAWSLLGLKSFNMNAQH